MRAVTQPILSVGCALDLEKLIIISGKRCWVLSVDALVISMDGNVLGALSIATKVLLLPRMPTSLWIESPLSSHL